MLVRIRTKNGKTMDVPRDITLNELHAKLAALGEGNTSELNVNWFYEEVVQVWGAPWPGADFSGNVTL